MKEKMMQLQAIGLDFSDWKELAEQGYKFVGWCDGYSSEYEDFEELLDDMVDSIIGEEYSLDFDEKEDIDHEAKIVEFSFTY